LLQKPQCAFAVQAQNTTNFAATPEQIGRMLFLSSVGHGGSKLQFGPASPSDPRNEKGEPAAREPREFALFALIWNDSA
jgi:hypothetical protein